MLSVGLGLANGPASSGSTAAVSADQVGSAAGISNMARYVGAAVAVAAIAMVNNAVANNHKDAGESAVRCARRGAGGLRADDGDLVAAGVLLIGLMRRHRPTGTPAVERAAAAAASTHTIPIEPAANPVTHENEEGNQCLLLTCVRPSKR